MLQASRKESFSQPAVESMIWSIRGRGKWSFGQCLFSDVKFTHIRRMSVSFFGTITVFASHSLYLISLMKSAASNLLISLPRASARGSDSLRMDFLTGLVSGKTLSACSANSLGTPGMSTGHQAKISQRSRRNSTSAPSYAVLRSLAISAVLEAYVGWTCTFLVLTVESKDMSGVFCLVTGGSPLSVTSRSLTSSSCMPKDWEILLKSLSHWSDRVKLPWTVMTPLGPGILSSRYA